MESMLYVIGSHMESLAESLQQCGTNLANVDTPGFKRLVSKFRAESETTPATDSTQPDVLGVPARWPQLISGGLDLTAGPLRVTGRDLDAALNGPGYFAVDTDDGERYTRKGRMYVNGDGELTDGFGHPYVAANGTLRIPATAQNITIQPNGDVMADNALVGELLLVELPQADKILPEGHCLLRYEGNDAREAVDTTVTQRAIEESNVEPTREMIALVNISRYYEIASRVAKRVDSMKESLLHAAV